MKRSIAYPTILVLMITTIVSGIGWYRADKAARGLADSALDSMDRELVLLQEDANRAHCFLAGGIMVSPTSCGLGEAAKVAREAYRTR